MSQLGKAVRELLLAQGDASIRLPGGIYPEVAAADVQMPFMIYTGSEAQRVHHISGKVMYTQETVELAVSAKTRSECESLIQWVSEALTPPSWQMVTGVDVRWWKMDTHGDISEVLLDGADDSARIGRMSLIGAVAPS